MRRPVSAPACLAPKLAALVLSAAIAPSVLAQAAAGSAPAPVGEAGPAAPPLNLKPSYQLQDALPEAERHQQPVFIFGDQVSGRPNLETTVEGNAELRRRDTVIRADRLEYYQPDDKATGRGNVRLNRMGNIYEGPALELKVDAFEGVFTSPSYYFLKNDAYGTAERIDFIDDKRTIARNATFSTCRRQPGPSWLPDWILSASSVRFDQDEDEGEATDAVLRFKGVPIRALPDITFPLSDKRRSGFLPTTFVVDNLSGIDLIAPYYWNIAPNRDLTVYPELMTRRGVNLGGDFRYLESNYRGNVRADYMLQDKLRNRSRWGWSSSHTGVYDAGALGLGPVGLSLNLNRVSDDNYWRDFPRATTSLTQRLLVNDGALYWANGPLSATLRATKYQVLQDVGSPIVPPYDRLPQLTGNYTRSNIAGFDVGVAGDFTRFQAAQTLTLQPNGSRAYTLGQISYPWRTPGFSVTPKLQLHSTRYAFDAPLANGATSAARNVPTFSLDGTAVLERPSSFLGRAVTQTLEPRAFYVYTPFRDQSFLPSYDSGVTDFNFATIFTENPFGGNDRIADNNLLTLGATSRFLEPTTGAELLRFGVAQRLRFAPQRVTLPGGIPDSQRFSDILVGGSVNWSSKWSASAIVQHNMALHVSERASMSARYTPGNYRVISASYNYQAGFANQIDIGWQWPLDDLWRKEPDAVSTPGQGLGEGRWYTVGRLNYSAMDRKLVDGIVGFEYDAGCWIGRVVLDRLQRAGQAANTRILFQLELVGFSRLGSNPLQTLRNSIPRYQYLREKTATPSRFSNYE